MPLGLYPFPHLGLLLETTSLLQFRCLELLVNDSQLALVFRQVNHVAPAINEAHFVKVGLQTAVLKVVSQVPVKQPVVFWGSACGRLEVQVKTSFPGSVVLPGLLLRHSTPLPAASAHGDHVHNFFVSFSVFHV